MQHKMPSANQFHWLEKCKTNVYLTFKCSNLERCVTKVYAVILVSVIFLHSFFCLHLLCLCLLSCVYTFSINSDWKSLLSTWYNFHKCCSWDVLSSFYTSLDWNPLNQIFQTTPKLSERPSWQPTTKLCKRTLIKSSNGLKSGKSPSLSTNVKLCTMGPEQ